MVEVDKDLLSVALSKALVDAVTVETRDKIFAGALNNYLFAPSSRDDAPISQAFRNALDHAVRDLAKEIVSQPDNLERIKAEVQKGLDLALESIAEQVRGKMTRFY
jgi:hypothetical protein